MNATTPGAARFDRGEHRSVRAAIFGTLRRDIISGRFEPGKSIKIKELQARFGVGLSALREALCQLEADGLVIAEEQRGFRIAPVSETDLVDLTRTRCEVETFAIRDAVAHGDLEWNAQLRSAFDKLVRIPKNTAVYAEAHRNFHDLLVAPCRSTWMKRFRATMREHAERYRALAASHNDEGRDVDGEHRGLVDAVIARNADLAAELLAAHVRETAAILMRVGLTVP
jgi:DNA-binding GntR family transcriptional regulator